MEIKKEKVKGGHELYIPPLRRGSETTESFSDDLNENKKHSNKHSRKPEVHTGSAAADKPIKSILKKGKPEVVKSKSESKVSKPEMKPEVKAPSENEIEKKNQREQKEINNFVQSKLTLC